MASLLLSVSALTGFLLVICTFILRRLVRRLLPSSKPDPIDFASSSPEAIKLSQTLAALLPGSVVLPHEASAFERSMKSYWAQQECEVIPACYVKPTDLQQLCTAVSVLKREYDERAERTDRKKGDGLFAVRSGGHSPLPGAASVKEGVVIDLGLFNEVTPSEDGSSVVIGAGAKWADVSIALDARGLAVVGGRNSAVGVGGLILGGKFDLLVMVLADGETQTGGISFFSPRFGFACSNVLSYEVVLASGQVTTASASTNSDLWRALKGGATNFGIVTRFTARSFPFSRLWSGFLYMPGSRAVKVLAAFHECLDKADIDHHAAGPIACFSHIQAISLYVIAINLVYTKLPEKDGKWPACWANSSFASLWRFWSTCRVRTLTSANDEMSRLNPPGRRQVFGTTTIKNDPATLAAAHAAYCDTITSMRHVKVKDLVFTLVLQPLLPDWAHRGDPNMLGLEDTHEPLVMINFTVNWADGRDDEYVKTMTRRTLERIEAFAEANQTGHRYRYLNYCAEWQRPFVNYGEENWRFLQAVSRKYDPEGLFQWGCNGGFKLDVG